MATEMISLTELRPRLSELVDRAHDRFERFVVTRRGRAAAVLLAAEEFEGLLETLEILSDDEQVSRLAEAERNSPRAAGTTLKTCARSCAVATVRLSSHARKSYERLARSDRRLFDRIERALDLLAEEPEAGKPLQGPLRGRRSYRVGPLRIVYRFVADELLVLVLDIAHRGAVYREAL